METISTGRRKVGMMKEIDFLLKSLELKDEKRTGWELRNIEQPESVADHSWGVALLTLIYSDKDGLDTGKCIKIALIHGLAEYQTGDLVTRAESDMQEISKNQKEKLEHRAMDELTGLIDGEEVLLLWKEYEHRETEEAKFVKDMDMIDLCLTALKYEKQGRYDPGEDNENFQEYDNLDEFFATTETRLSTETGKQLFKEIKERYNKAKEK